MCFLSFLRTTFSPGGICGVVSQNRQANVKYPELLFDEDEDEEEEEIGGVVTRTTFFFP